MNGLHDSTIRMIWAVVHEASKFSTGAKLGQLCAAVSDRLDVNPDRMLATCRSFRTKVRRAANLAIRRGKLVKRVVGKSCNSTVYIAKDVRE